LFVFAWIFVSFAFSINYEIDLYSCERKEKRPWPCPTPPFSYFCGRLVVVVLFGYGSILHCPGLSTSLCLVVGLELELSIDIDGLFESATKARAEKGKENKKT
jgi:hypothetical protein